MPLYDFKCDKCGKKVEDVLMPIYDNFGEEIKEYACIKCGVKMRKLFPLAKAKKMFIPQQIDDGVFARNMSDVRDHIKRYNDSEQASKTGKIAILE